jgi:hypothetical protein
MHLIMTIWEFSFVISPSISLGNKTLYLVPMLIIVCFNWTVEIIYMSINIKVLIDLISWHFLFSKQFLTFQIIRKLKLLRVSDLNVLVNNLSFLSFKFFIFFIDKSQHILKSFKICIFFLAFKFIMLNISCSCFS